MRRALGSAALIVAASLLTAGCAAIPWDQTEPGDALSDAVTDAHGLLFALGPAEVEAAGLRLATALAVNELTLSGSATGPTLGTQSLTVRWEDIVLGVERVALALTDEGLEARAVVGATGATMVLGDGLIDLCQLAFTVSAGELTIPLSLTADKFGRVKASSPASATLASSDLEIDWGACSPEVLALPLGEATLAVFGAIEQSAANALAPALVGEIPAALRLDVAVGFSLTVGSDSVGAGVVRVAVGSARDTELPFELRNGRLLVPMGVGLEAERHPCVPEAPLPEIATTAIPPFQAGLQTGWTLISVDVAHRALAATWAAGGVCGARALGETRIAAADLLDVWPALSALPARSELRLEVWPRALPRLSAQPGDQLLVSTGLVDVDIYGELDGAWVRLATVTVDGETHAGLEADDDGLLRLMPDTVTLRASGVAAGLLGTPDPAIGEALLTPIVELSLLDRPVLTVPPGAGPAEDAVAVEVRDDYLWVAR